MKPDEWKCLLTFWISGTLGFLLVVAYLMKSSFIELDAEDMTSVFVLAISCIATSTALAWFIYKNRMEILALCNKH